MKIATYNVNGVHGRLELLLRWLKEASPDVVCLQELKAPQEKFPAKALEDAGYGAVWLGQKSWNGVAILAKGREPHLTRKGLPREPDDTQSRYIEAIVDGIVIGGLYLPNGNPYPGPKFDYKLRWFQRLHDYATELLELEVPVVLAGDFNVMPTELDVYKPERWVDDALFRVEVREAFRNLVDQGWTDALRKLHPDEQIYTFWDYFRNAYARDAGLRIDHFLLSPETAGRLSKAEVDRHVRGWDHTSDHAPVVDRACRQPSASDEAEKESRSLMVLRNLSSPCVFPAWPSGNRFPQATRPDRVAGRSRIKSLQGITNGRRWYRLDCRHHHRWYRRLVG